MKQRFTYILVTLFLLLPLSMSAASIGNIHGVELFGTMNADQSAWHQPDWKFDNKDGSVTPANHWAKDFYFPASTTYYFLLHLWYGDNYANEGMYRTDATDFEMNTSKQEKWSWYSVNDTYTKMKLPTVASASGYVKVNFDFWGDYGSDSRLFLTQSVVASLSTTLPAVAVDGGQSTTLTPTTTGGSGGYSYTYEVTQGDKVVTDVLTVNADGTATFTAPVLNEATNYTVTVTTKDTHSQLSGLATTTATTTITVNPSIVVYLDMSQNTWWTTVSIYRYWGSETDNATGFHATKIDKPFDGKKVWYSFIFPLKNLDERIGFVVRSQDYWGNGANNTNQTVDVDLTAEDIEQGKKTGIAFSVLSATQSDKVYKVDRYGPSFYVNNHYIESKIGGVTHKSNTVTTTGTLSYYTSEAATSYTLYSGNDFRGYKPTALTKETAGNVYVAEMKNDVLDKPTIYTGDYYIGTDASSAQWWTKFDDLTDDQKQDAVMTYFAPNVNYQDTYNYYWTKWVDASDAQKANVKARVGNQYNYLLAEIGGGNFTDEYGNITRGANVRFGYDPQKNIILRALIDGSTAGDNYVSIYTTEADKLYDSPQPGANQVTATNALKFRDVSDWVYEIDVWAKPNVTAIVQAKYNNNEQHLFGDDANGNPISKTLLGAADDALYRMRVIYDFKTNRVIAGWMPETETIEGATTIASNLMIMRKENDQATQLQLAEAASLTPSKQIYTVLEVNRDTWNASGGYFWISLPYDCYIQDIFGIEDYGTKWTIQRYRGDKRAELGWFREIPTFWANMKRNTTAKMEAGRGYVVRLNLDETDFTDVDEKDAEGNNVKKAALRLYFPSHESNITLSESRQQTTDVPEHDRSQLSSDKRRIADDSNWNVIGVMGFQDMNSSGWKIGDDPNEKEETTNPSEVRKDRYFYTWTWDNEKGKGVYTLASSANNTFASTQAYMVQFGGTIEWNKSVATSSELQARKAPAQHQNAVLCLNIANEKESDKTYLQLDEEATTEYDLNSDLGKIVNEGCVQVYTLTAPRTVTDAAGNPVVEQSQLAANYLPIESQSVAIGLQAPAAGEYTFSMPSVPAGIIPTLYDSKIGATINLAFDKYTVSLEQGTDEKRFTLQLNVQNTPTGCEDLTTHSAFRITQLGNSLLISGVEGEADIRLYDALGRMLYHTTNAHETIPVSQAGVYLVSINGTVQRILIK